MPKNFAQNTSLYFSKVFGFPKDFFQKALWSGFGAEAPTFNAHKKHGNAVLFYLSSIVGTAFQTLLQEAF